MADAGPAATVVGCWAFSKTVHIARLDLWRTAGGAGAGSRTPSELRFIGDSSAAIKIASNVRVT